jgi:SAM-dependent methyltransferase
MDARETSAAAERNAEPILSVLRAVLPPRGLVLELASGTGQHIAHFAGALPELDWQPSEFDRARHPSIRAWTEEMANVRAPLAIDAAAEDWGVAGPFAAMLAVNLIHIAPWEAALGLFAGAARLLPPGAPLILYGPYLEGEATAPSNRAFDESLRARDPRWGVRELGAVIAAAESSGLQFDRRVPMPANNQVLVFRPA